MKRGQRKRGRAVENTRRDPRMCIRRNTYCAQRHYNVQACTRLRSTMHRDANGIGQPSLGREGSGAREGV
ncbi:MAG: hypothetical protein GY820_10865 [Gammaproteobacteria bacterium]|nr:hypothetical protein [Gammaproteobacteria bacterium]